MFVVFVVSVGHTLLNYRPEFSSGGHVLNLRTLLLFGIIVMFVAGCVTVAPQGNDAIAVWQHQGDTWDIHYSLYDHGTKQWQVPSGGKSAPIAQDAGDDQDPDVSSTEKSAVAVWTKQTGGNTIFYSIWDGSNWTSPAKLSSDDQDTDPTVAMGPSGDALAVWVSRGTSLYSSYYTNGVGWTTPERLNTSGISRVSLPELAYNERDGNYYLVFTGTHSTMNAYAAAYSKNGWSSPIMLGRSALLDNNVPTNQRTGAGAARNKDEVTFVWPGPNNEVYSAKLGAPSSKFADGQMPDVSYDSSDTPNGAYTDDEDLFHQPNVLSPAPEKTISAMKSSDDRNSLTFIRDRSVGLDVWWTRVIPSGQIFYSYHEGGAWQGVDKIDPSLDGTYNRNPAVSPLRQIPSPEKGPYCGDGLINLPWEQCEVGVACANPAALCNIANCQCLEEVPPQNDTVSCSDNSWASAFGVPLWAPGMICKDDCRATFGKEWSCDAKCNCVKQQQPPPQKNTSCVENTKTSFLGFSPLFMPGNICVDDCKRLGPEYKCDAVSCFCEKTEQNLTCSQNTESVVNGAGSLYKPGMQCADDCANSLGSAYSCDPVDCLCKKDTGDSFYCAGNSFATGISGANTFNPLVHQCLDNCDVLGDDYVCNAATCICETEDKGEVSCSGRKLESVISSNFGGPGPAAFDPATMICKDDCEKELYCDAVTCQCEPRETRYCTEGTTEDIMLDRGEIQTELVGLDLTAGGISLPLGGTDSFFDVFTELDVPKQSGQPPDSFFDIFFEIDVDTGKPTSSRDSFFDVFPGLDLPTRDKFDPSVMLCKDNCEVLGPEFQCEPISCKCEYKPKKEISCYDNSLDFDYEVDPATGKVKFNNKFNPQVNQCKDDCDRAGSGLVCNPETCYCEEEAFKCAGNTFDLIENGKNEFSWLMNRCEDNCDSLGEGYQCDPFSCVCRKKPNETVYCDANTVDAYVDDSSGYAQTTRFDSSTQQCIDNCEDFRAGSVCDPVSCYCVPKDGERVSCALHTDHVTVTDVNKYNAQTMQCADDCEEYYGSDSYCNPTSCTCSKTPPSPLYCSRNTKVPNVPGNQYAAGLQCIDNCVAAFGTGYICDPEGCFCKNTRVVTPRCGDGYVSNANTGGGGNEECDVGRGNPDTCSEGKQCNPESCLCEVKEDIVVGVCGDGIVSGTEQCDYGSASTNKCYGEGNPYCTQECLCKPLETSPRCGDGKITSPEECDGGNVKTNICPSGYKCDTPSCSCVVEEGTGQCGDGTVTPPEECDHGNSYTAECPSGKLCSSCQCVEPSEITHLECDYSHGQCVSVQGQGQNECSSDADCEEEEVTPICGNGVREGTESCDGNDDALCPSGAFCSNDCRCVSETTLYCGDGIVTPDIGEECETDGHCSGEQACGNLCKCVDPPTLDCPYICANAGYSEVVPGVFGSDSACQAEAAESAETCTTKCVYSFWYQTSNVAGSAECCCKEVKTFACTDCPGSNPQCPDAKVICPANEP